MFRLLFCPLLSRYHLCPIWHQICIASHVLMIVIGIVAAIVVHRTTSDIRTIHYFMDSCLADAAMSLLDRFAHLTVPDMGDCMEGGLKDYVEKYLYWARRE